jgi:hypothetical protein
VPPLVNSRCTIFVRSGRSLNSSLGLGLASKERAHSSKQQKITSPHSGATKRDVNVRLFKDTKNVTCWIYYQNNNFSRLRLRGKLSAFGLRVESKRCLLLAEGPPHSRRTEGGDVAIASLFFRGEGLFQYFFYLLNAEWPRRLPSPEHFKTTTFRHKRYPPHEFDTQFQVHRTQTGSIQKKFRCRPTDNESAGESMNSAPMTTQRHERLMASNRNNTLWASESPGEDG